MSELKEIKQVLAQLVDKVDKLEKSSKPDRDPKLKSAMEKLERLFQKKQLVRIGELTRSKRLYKDIRLELQRRKGVVVIRQDGTTYIVNTEKPIESLRKPQRARQKKVKSARKRKPRMSDTQSRKLFLIRKELEKGRTLTVDDLSDMGIRGNNYRLISKYLKPSRWAKVTKVKGRFVITATQRTTSVASTKPSKKPKLTKYNLFLKKRIPELVKQGYKPSEAWKRSVKEWQDSKKKDSQPSFPEFESVDKEHYPILKGIIEGCIKGKKITYSGVSYALNLNSQNEYRRFIDDIITNTIGIKRYFGIEKGSFRWDGREIAFMS